MESLSQRVSAVETSPIRKLMDHIDSMSGVIKLHVGEPDFDTPIHIKTAAKQALDEGYTHYSHTAGLPELRHAIAEKLLRESRIKVDPETEITVTVGGYAALFSALQTVLDPQDEAIIIEPSWPSYKGLVRLAGGKPVPLCLDGPSYNLDISRLKDIITEKTKIVILNNPNNPTGAVYTSSQLKALASLARKYDLCVLADEVYEKIIFDKAIHMSIGSFPEMKERTILINSFSKTYAMTGWRVGYVIANPRITSGIRRIHSFSVSCVSPILQKGALAALKGPQDCVKNMVEGYKERRNITVEALNSIPGINCLKPKGTFYIFPNIQGTGLQSTAFAERLLRKGKVATIPGSAFGSSGEGHVRMSIAMSSETLLEAAQRIKRLCFARNSNT